MTVKSEPLNRPVDDRRKFWVRSWLLLVGILVYGMVLVGGATRLTDSGLSITDWRPIMGAIPPLTSDDWIELFEQYKGTAEYQLQNKGMTLSEFETIFWWEWGHRFFGRVIGLISVAGLVGFSLMKWLDARLTRRMAVIIGLGALQAVIGMWMVASGLGETTRVDVAPYRLMTHFCLALLILAAIYWTWRDEGDAVVAAMPQEERLWAVTLLAMISLQLASGALVAGLDAGRTYTDWPTMAGSVVPNGYWIHESGWRNIFENVATTQFNHRFLAYVILLVAIIATLRAWNGSTREAFAFLLVAVVTQSLWGIMTLVNAAPLELALGHQAIGVIVLLASVNLVWLASMSKRDSAQSD